MLAVGYCQAVRRNKTQRQKNPLGKAWKKNRTSFWPGALRFTGARKPSGKEREIQSGTVKWPLHRFRMMLLNSQWRFATRSCATAIVISDPKFSDLLRHVTE
jgi:hypothetical protein